MVPPIILLLLSATLGVFIAPDRILATNRLVVYAAGVLVFALAAWGGRQPRRLFTASILLLLVGVAAAVLSLLVTDWPVGQLLNGLPLADRFPTQFHLTGSGVPNPADGANPRMVAGTMVLFLPLAFSLAFFAKKPTLRLLGGLAGLVLLFPLYLSQAPQGLLALAIGLGLVFAFRAPWSLALQAGLALLAAVAWRLWNSRLPEGLLERLLVRVQARLETWPVTLQMIRDMPFSGIGLNNFPTVQPLYSFSLANQPHAHNIFLQTAADQGVLGLVAFIALFAIGFRSAWQAYHASQDPNVRIAVLGCAGGCAAYLGFGLWDSMSLGNKPAVAVWALLGLLYAAGQIHPQLPAAPAPRNKRWRYALMVGLGAAALLGAPWWGSVLLVNTGRVLYNPLALRAEIVSGERISQIRWMAKSAEKLNPYNGRALILQGYAAALGDRVDEAMLALERGLALEPQDQRSHLELADICHQQGDVGCALEYWQNAEAYMLLISRGQAPYNSGDYTTAETWFSQAVAVDSSQTTGWMRLLAAQKKQGNWVQAQATAQAFQEQFPTFSAAYEELITILGQLKQPELAVQMLAQGFEKAQPPGAQLYYFRSRYAAERKEYLTAEQDARQAIALMPSAGGYLIWLGDIFQRQGRYVEAQTQYELTAREASSPEWIWRAKQRIGSLYAAQDLWSQAIEEYQQAVALSEAQAVKPNVLAQNYAALGDILKQSGDFSGAESAYRQALKLDPQNLSSQKGLAELEPK